MDLAWLFADVPIAADSYGGVKPNLPSPTTGRPALLPPHAPSPTYQHAVMKPRAPTVCATLVPTGGDASASPRSRAKPPALTLADVERQIVAAHGPMPADMKRRLARAELKRLKHCETVRQSRVRKKNQRTDLRGVHAELEQQLTARLVQFRAAHDWMHFDERRARDLLLKRFVHSIYEVRALRRERGELAERIAVFDALGEQLQRLQGDYEIPRLLGARTSIGTVHFEQLTLEEAGAIMVDSHAQALSFFAAMKRRASGDVECEDEDGGREGVEGVEGERDPPETGKTMGWTKMQRITRDGRMQFNFTKRIETVGVEELVAKSWAMYCDFTLYHGIYASVQKLEILQRINDNTLLIRRDLQDGPGAPVFRTVFLLFRIKIDGGYLICFRSHNPRVVVEDDDDPSVQWMDMFYWLMITEPDDALARAEGAAGPRRAPGRGCDVTYGGNVLNHRSARYAARWKYQIAMALLRWESNTAAPLFAFCR